MGIVAAVLGVLVAQPLAGTAATLPQHPAGSAVPQLRVPPVSAPSATAPVRSTVSNVSALAGGAARSAQASGAPGDPASAAPDTTAATGLAGGGNVQPAGGSGSAAVWERLVWGHAVC
jgi:hypothetical protein